MRNNQSIHPMVDLRIDSEKKSKEFDFYEENHHFKRSKLTEILRFEIAKILEKSLQENSVRSLRLANERPTFEPMRTKHQYENEP